MQKNGIEYEIQLINTLQKSVDFMKNIENLDEKFSAPIVNSIGALPKNELGNMAESLIHATSLKRKVSSDLESVGAILMLPSFQKATDLFGKRKKIILNMI